METSSTTTSELRWPLFATHAERLWLAVITLVGTWCRLSFRDAPIRYDEAFTFLTFVRHGVDKLFDYPAPNNHILHTLFVRATTDLFGREPAVMRLPALLFGVLCIPLSFQLARRLDSRATGYLAAVGVATLPYLVLYSSIARGYSLMVALTLGLTLLGLTLIEQLQWRRTALLALLSALGMLTMPSMAFALAGVGIWLAVLLLLSRQSKRSVVVHLAAYGALTAALTLAFYTPTLMISGADAVTNNRFVAPLPWQEFATKLGPHLRATASDFARDVPLAAAVVCGLLMTVALAGAFAARNWAALLLLPTLLLGAAVLLVLKHSIPFPRTWIYLLPFALVLADIGLGVLLQRTAAAARPVIGLALLVAGIFACTQIVSHDLLARYGDVGVFPEAAAIVQRLKPLVHRNEPVYARNPGDFPTRFYLWYYGVPDKHLKARRHPQEFIVVRKGIDRIPDHDPKLLFEHNQVEVYSRPHRPKPPKH